MASIDVESFAHRVLRDMSSAVLVLDRNGEIIYLNAPAAAIFETDESGEVGEPDVIREQLLRIIENSYNDDFNEYIFQAIYQKHTTHIGRVRFQALSGRKYVFRISSSYLENRKENKGEIVVTLEDVTQEVELQQKVKDSSVTFTVFLFGYTIWMVIYALWVFLKQPVSADAMTGGVEVLAVVMMIFILRYTSLTTHDLGITLAEPARTVRVSLLIAACSVVILCVLKAVIRIFDPSAFSPEAPFFDISRFGLRQIAYVFTAGIQEFLARSVVQGNLKRVMAGRHKAVGSIVLSSLIFSTMHMHLGFLFMAGALILASLEGILYEKQQSILGVWIVHWVFGVSGTLLCLIDH